MLAKISNFENFSKFLTQTLRNIVYHNQIQAGVIYKVGTTRTRCTTLSSNPLIHKQIYELTKNQHVTKEI